jgi:hypothetical protein
MWFGGVGENDCQLTMGVAWTNMNPMDARKGGLPDFFIASWGVAAPRTSSRCLFGKIARGPVETNNRNNEKSTN